MSYLDALEDEMRKIAQEETEAWIATNDHDSYIVIKNEVASAVDTGEIASEVINSIDHCELAMNLKGYLVFADGDQLYRLDNRVSELEDDPYLNAALRERITSLEETVGAILSVMTMSANVAEMISTGGTQDETP
mgnify:CR=1 FL=1